MDRAGQFVVTSAIKDFIVREGCMDDAASEVLRSTFNNVAFPDALCLLGELCLELLNPVLGAGVLFSGSCGFFPSLDQCQKSEFAADARLVIYRVGLVWIVCFSALFPEIQLLNVTVKRLMVQRMQHVVGFVLQRHCPARQRLQHLLICSPRFGRDDLQAAASILERQEIISCVAHLQHTSVELIVPLGLRYLGLAVGVDEIELVHALVDQQQVEVNGIGLRIPELADVRMAALHGSSHPCGHLLEVFRECGHLLRFGSRGSDGVVGVVGFVRTGCQYHRAAEQHGS